MHLLAKIWQNTIKRPYHFLMPRIRIRKCIYGYKYVININDHLSFLRYKGEAAVAAVLSEKWGTVWDVGCNFGLFSILSAKSDNRVVSFDLSELALSYLERSSKLNQVLIQTVNRPLSIKSEPFTRPKSADCTNAVRTDDQNPSGTSITYREAAEKFGVPNLIKMDIEGGEISFFSDPEFLSWITDNAISILVELHRGYCPDDSILQQAKREQLDSSHVLFRMHP